MHGVVGLSALVSCMGFKAPEHSIPIVWGSGTSEHRWATSSPVFESNQGQEKAGGARVRCASRMKRLKTVVPPLPISSRLVETVAASHA